MNQYLFIIDQTNQFRDLFFFCEENKLNVLLSKKHHDATNINAIDPLLQPWPPLGSYHVLAGHKIPQPCSANQ